MPRREEMLARVRDAREPWDLVVVGGGCTGVGTALDAAARGWRVLLLEKGDFGHGTSSRSTKLIHGGVRYLRQGRVGLVRESLAEREVLRRNAPHHVRDLEFAIPCFRGWETALYRTGLRLYDGLGRSRAFPRSEVLSRRAVLERIPNVRSEGLRGAVAYHDGQFDDARLLLHLVTTAAERGAALVNYARVTALARPRADAPFEVRARDEETGEEHRVLARAVVNAAGPMTDALRRMEEPGAEPMVVPSQGAHVVLDGTFLGGATAVMVPRTEDRRVIFAIPWRGRALVGTTDTALGDVPDEPRCTREEVAFLLRTVGRYLARPPGEADVRSVFAGVRPLVRSRSGARTAALARDHVVRLGPRGLVTVTGGKWTTYRRMAEQVVDRVERASGRRHRPSGTRDLPVHGHDPRAERHGRLAPYGSDADRVRASGAEYPDGARPLHPRVEATVAEVVWAAREEMARTVEDVLARRTRELVLDAAAAREAAPRVAEVLARELGRDAAWRRAQVEAFEEVVRRALPP